MKRTFAFIFARGGSKGLPGKNLLSISGMSLTARAIMIAKNIDCIERVFLSSDCDKIIEEGKQSGAEIIKRPKILATDTASEWDAWKHAINVSCEKYGTFDQFISLPPTAPGREVKDVERCINSLDDGIDLVFTGQKANSNPWFNMVKRKADGTMELACSNKNISRRQDAPTVYDMTTVAYAAKVNFILSSKNMWDGRLKMVEVSKENAIDIDTEFDFNIARYLIESKNEK